MKKQNQILLSIAVIAIIIAVSITSYNLTSKTDCVESETTGNLLCFVNEISPLALVTSVRDSYEAGSDIRFGEDLYYYEGQVPFKSARVYLFKVENGQEIQLDSWSVATSLNNQIGTTDFQTSVFGDEGELLRKYIYNVIIVKAPTEGGDYIYRDSITSKSGENLDSSRLVDKRGFSVLNSIRVKVVDNTPVSCEPYESNWIKGNAITGGTQYYKEFGQDCGGSLDTEKIEWKTTCDEGYLAKGSTTTIINDKTICILQEGATETDSTEPTDDTTQGTIGDDEPVIFEPTNKTKTNETGENKPITMPENIWLYSGIAFAVLILIYLIYTEAKK